MTLLKMNSTYKKIKKGEFMESIYQKKDKRLIFEISEDIDECVVQKIRRRLDNEIERYMPKEVIFDFNKVSFMDSAGIGLIMGRYKKVMDKGDITIVGVRESVKRILLISGLHKIVNIYELKGQEA